MTINDKAHRVAQIMNQERGVDGVVCFDPALILVIISIITQLVRLYRSCGYSESEAVKQAADPGFLGRWQMGRIIKQKTRNTAFEGHYHDIKHALLRSGQEMSVEDMSLFYRDIK